MDMEFIARRITELRMKKNVSEYQMSRDLGHGRSYIQNIVARRSNPSMQEFFGICEYLNVSPAVFFEERIEEPMLVQCALEGIKRLSERELEAVEGLIKLFNKRKQEIVE